MEASRRAVYLEVDQLGPGEKVFGPAWFILDEFGDVINGPYDTEELAQSRIPDKDMYEITVIVKHPHTGDEIDSCSMEYHVDPDSTDLKISNLAADCVNRLGAYAYQGKWRQS